MRHKRIGLLGGTSPESTVSYYQYLTQRYTSRYGDFGFPEILVYSICFQDFLDWTNEDQWDRVASKMAEVFDALAAAGADFGMITANTLHLVFDDVQRRTTLPLLSIVDATAEAVAASGLERVGLLGTERTMNGPLYPDALNRVGIATLIPEPEDRAEVDRVIYEELTHGETKPESKRELLQIVDVLRDRGAGGIILGCTELPLLLPRGEVPLPTFDTTAIHAEKALRMAVEG